MRWEHEGRHVIQRKVDAGRVRESVDAIRRRRDPDDEHAEEEEKGDARVEPGPGIGRFSKRFFTRQGAHAEEFWPGWRDRRWAGDGDSVGRGSGGGILVGAGVEAGVAVEFLVEVICVGGASFGGRGGVVRVRGRGGDVFDCDVDGGGDGTREGVFVEGVEEAFELVTATVDDEPSFDVDCEGEDDGSPESLLSCIVLRGSLKGMAYHTIP